MLSRKHPRAVVLLGGDAMKLPRSLETSCPDSKRLLLLSSFHPSFIHIIFQFHTFLVAFNFIFLLLSNVYPSI